jgi:hypothetical protein
MKRIIFIFLVLAISLATVIIMVVRSSAIIKKQSGGAELELFNGQNLDGWYTFIKGRGRNIDPLKVFTVENNLICISGEEWGCITTNDEFENYKITLEFKWGMATHSPRVDKARDSGLLLHSTGEDGGSDSTWMHSIECQIIEGGTGDLLVVGDGSSDFSITCPVAAEKQGGSYVYQTSGKYVTVNEGRINWYGRDPEWEDIRDYRGEKDIERPVGEWNKIECIVKGNEIVVFLNGILVNHAVDVKPQKGKIQIQSEGAEIFFRSAVINSL